MELQDLLGKHMLSGVDMGHESIKNTWGDDFESCQTLNFTLDGVTYSAIEDPSDGYRSSMNEIRVTDAPAKNTFAPQEVLGVMRRDDDYKNDVLDLIDTTTGKVVLSVGTTNTDDYYPSFEAVFAPENMAINAGKE